MTIEQLTKRLLSIQEDVTRLKLGGAGARQSAAHGVADAIRRLGGPDTGAEHGAVHMAGVFTKIGDTLDLPEDICEQYQNFCAGMLTRFAENPQKTALSRKCDEDYLLLISEFAATSVEQLLERAAADAERCRKENPKYHELLCRYYLSWYRIQRFHPEDPAFVERFGAVYRFIKENAAGLIDLYSRFGDYRSKYSLLMMLKNWLTFTPDLRYHSIEHTFPNYFDLDLFAPAPGGEVFVDCGAYDGDSIKSFIDMYGENYKRIYAYEIVPDIFKSLQENLKEYPNIVYCNRGVSDKNGTAMLSIFESASSIIRGGGIPAPVVALDDDIKEEITFIKMDIEGAEPLALLGAQKHIQNSRPKLAICLYHTLPHLLEIPFLIHQINPSYQLYFRHLHDPKDEGIPFPIEYMVYAK